MMLTATTHETNQVGEIALRDFPCLQQAAWNRAKDAVLTRVEALGIYERNWKYIRNIPMGTTERQALDELIRNEGRGIFAI